MALSEAELRVEELAAKFHEIYMVEARRQGDVRHKDAYADLSENIKEFDRVLARYVLAERERAVQEALERVARMVEYYEFKYDGTISPRQEIVNAIRSLAALGKGQT